MNFLYSFHPKAIAFSIGPLSIYWYGLFIVLGILLGFFISLYIAKKKQVSANYLYNLFFYFIISGLIGGRLAHVLSEWNYYKEHLSDIYKIWQGGLALHGVLFAGLVVAIIYTKIKKISFWSIGDIFAVSIPLAQAIGRWGNYFNQEIFGKPTDLAWGIPIDFIKRPNGFEAFEYFHPLFLYESVLNLIIFIILLFFINTKFANVGETTLLYFILYSLVRFFLDFLRIDPLSLGPLSVIQWVSILIITGCKIIFLVRRHQLKPQASI